MKNKIVHIKNTEFARKVQQVVDEKRFIYQQIKAGKFKEIKSDIKFATPI